MTTKLSRRTFTAMAGAAAGAALLPGRRSFAADDAHTLSLRLDWLPSGYQSPIFLAKEKGWFQKAGIDVNIDQGNGSATTVQLIGAGQYDIGFASLSAMAFARGKGMPVVSIACFFRKGDLGLLVPTDSPIKSPADSKGKRLVYTAGSMEAPFLDAWFTKGGFTRNDVTLLQVDASAKIPTYLQPTSDGVFTSTAFTVAVVNDKKPTRSVLFADFGLNMPGFGVLSNESALKKKGDAIKKFASIVSGTWAYILNGHHEDEAVQALLKARAEQRLDPKIILGQLKDSLPFLYTPNSQKLPIGVQAEQDWEDGLKVMEAGKTIDPGWKVKDYYTNDYLDLDLIKSTGAST
jgi:NitT/TauT family transport system substrate-binding protein